MNKHKIGRRDFLRMVGIGGVAGFTALKFGWDSVPQQAEVVTETRLLMGTVVNLTLITTDRNNAQQAIDDCLNHMGELEAVLSRHRSDSQLSSLNRDGQLNNASPHLIDVLRQAIDISTMTAGAFDVTVKPLVNLYQNHNALPSDQDIQRTLTQVGYQNITLDDASVYFEQPGMSITLDGIAKGYIVDQGIAKLQQYGFMDVLVEAGGDLSASGQKSVDRPWRIGIQSPRENDMRLLGTFSVINEAVATSGDYMQSFSSDNLHHHILDPRSGYSSTELSSTTVIAPSTVLADAIATALMVIGPQDGLRVLGQWTDCRACMVTKSLKIIQSDGFSL